MNGSPDAREGEDKDEEEDVDNDVDKEQHVDVVLHHAVAIVAGALVAEVEVVPIMILRPCGRLQTPTLEVCLSLSQFVSVAPIYLIIFKEREN